MNFKEYEMKVYSNERGYFTRLVRYNEQKQEFENAFIYLQFRKGTIIPNKTTINVYDSWLSFYKSKEDKVVLYVFVNEYEIVQ